MNFMDTGSSNQWLAMFGGARFFSLLTVLFVLEMILKGYAMWRAAQNKQMIWFIALFIFNTLGILPLLYIFVFQNKSSVATGKKIKPADKKGR